MFILVLNVIHYYRREHFVSRKHMIHHERQQYVHNHCNSINDMSCSRVVHLTFSHVIVFETIMRDSSFKQHDYQVCKQSYYCVHTTIYCVRFKHRRHRSQDNEHLTHVNYTFNKVIVDSKKLNI